MNVEPRLYSLTQSGPPLTRPDAGALAIRVIELLDGMTLGQALDVLTVRIPQLLTDGHLVQVNTPQFRALKAAVGADHFPAPGQDPHSSVEASAVVASRPYDPDEYGPWEIMRYSADTRHLRWVHEVLMSARFRRVLEIGCFEGRSTTAFLDAHRYGRVGDLHLCDPNPHPSLQRVLSRFGLNNRVALHREPSQLLLARDGRWDLVSVDGDHSVANVRAEAALLLRARIPAVFAHDTSAHGRCPNCEGPQFIKAAFQAAGYRVLEDSLFRPGERTERGMFFATSEADLYEVALRAYRRHCAGPL